MCGRYATFGPVSISREAKTVLDQIELDIVSEINQREDQLNIAPTQKALVISHGEKGYEAKALRWGLVQSWAKDVKIGAKMINARSDSIIPKPKPKPSLRNAFAKRRCLVPASGYFEWKGESPNKQPYFIHDPAGHLLMVAGLWEGWRPSESEEWLCTFTIITGEPGMVSGDIHDRQPVILPPDLWQVWIEGTADEASATLVAAPEAELVYYPVTNKVGKPTNKDRENVEPITL